jgi:MATE family multidrug resistance protein
MNVTFSKELKKTWNMSVPIVASRLAGAAGGFVIMLLVAQLGHAQLAAGALINSVIFSLFVPLWTLFFAIGILVAREFGANRFAAAGDIFRHGMILAVILGVLNSIILWYIGPILIWLRQEPHLAMLTQQYFHAYMWGMIPSFWFSCLLNFVTGISKQKIVLFFTLINILFVLVLGYILIFGKFGMPVFGIAGAGYASAISLVLIDILMLWYMAANKEYQHYQLFMWRRKLSWNYTKKILDIGWPVTAMVFGELVIYSFSNIMAGWLGETSLAAQQITMQINLLAFMLPMGISQASSILISQDIGRKHLHTIRSLGHAGLFLGLIAVFATLLCYLAIPKVLIQPFLQDSSTHVETIHIAITLLAITGLMNIFDAIRNVSVYVLRGLQDTVVPMIIFLFLGAALTLPICYILGFTLHYGVVGIRWGFVIGFFVGAVILMQRFYKFTNLAYLTARLENKP